MIRSALDTVLLFGFAALVTRLGHASGVLYFAAGAVASALIVGRIVVALRLKRR